MQSTTKTLVGANGAVLVSRLAWGLRVSADDDLHHVSWRDLRLLDEQPIAEEFAAVEPALPPRLDVLLSLWIAEGVLLAFIQLIFFFCQFHSGLQM